MNGKELAEGLGIGLAPLVFMFVVGYMGYWFSYAGLTTQDKFAKIALFGLPFYLLVLIFGWINLSPIMRFTLVLSGSAGSLALSFIWSGGFRHFLSKTLFNHKILNEDGYHDLFEELYHKADIIETLMITVTLVNDTILIGYLTRDCCKLHISQGKMDQRNNIPLYVSEIHYSDGNVEEIEFKGEGNVKEITIIPSQSILHIKFSIKEL